MSHNAKSYSEINTYGRCPQRYFLRSVLRLQRKRKNPNLYQGSATHEGFQEFFLKLRETADYNHAYEVMDAWFQAEIDAIPERNPLLFDDELASAEILLQDAWYYCTTWIDAHEDEIKTWEILHVEEEFVIMLGDETNYEVVTFTPDLIIKDKNGFVWIVDFKTTSKMPNNGLPFADLQALLYMAGVRELYPELRGFIFSYIRKKRPTLPRLNKTHTSESKLYGHVFVNNLTKIDTSYEMLRDFLLEHAPALMGEPAHQRRLAELRDTNRFLWEERVTPSDEQLSLVLEDVLATLVNMKEAASNNRYPRTILNDLAGVQACSRCEFSRICHTALLGWNVEMVIDEEYEPRDPKNDYESEEDDDDESF